MRARHYRTLEAIFSRPTRAGLRWAEIESMLLACGADIEERAGSRIVIELNGVRAHAHRPHPRPTATKSAVEAIRRFLIEAGVVP